MAAMPVLGPSTGAESETQEFSIRVPKRNLKKQNVLDFNGVMKVDFKNWSKVKLQRENNMTDSFRGPEEEIPKFGAGSEFGRDAREEARKKKYGFNAKKYKAENQPWILKAQEKKDGKGEKKERKFKGIKKGGINDNTTYYVFACGPNNVIEAFPLSEWYKFQAVQNYKSLTAEEAEEEFMKRDKALNYFSLMARKRLKNSEEDDDEEEMLIGKKKSNKKAKDLKISEMDEWINSEDEESDEEEECKKKSDDEDDDKKKTKKDKMKKKKKKKVSDDEAFEESDDGDEEGRECDYISDSSASEGELELQKEIKSVDQEDALRKLLNSDEEDDEEDENEKEKDDDSDSSSGVESSSEQKKSKKPSSSESSRSATPTTSQSLKRSHSNSPDLSQAKRSRMDSGASTSMTSFSTYVPGSSESGITEDAVRRYLMRKPMTTTELLQKFKSKKTSLSSEQIVTIMTNILKNLNPTRKKRGDKTYFSIPPKK